MVRIAPLGLVSLLTWASCSLSSMPYEGCVDDAQCQAVFGSQSTCGGQGFCIDGPDEPCDVETPAEVETPYDGIDNDCDPLTPDDDLDGDGALFANDCDDNDPLRFLSGPLIVGIVSSEQVATLCDQRCSAMTEVQGNFELDGAIDDLTGLHCISDIAGSLGLDSTGVPSLAGLDNITRVRGDVVIQGEPALPDLTGLGGLMEIDGALRLLTNPRLEHAGVGLEALLRVGGDLEVMDNPRMADASATALSEGIVVEGSVLVDGNGLGLDFENPGFELETLRDPEGWLVFPEGSTNARAALTGDPLAESAQTFTARSGNASLRIFTPPEEDPAVSGAITVYQESAGTTSPGDEFELTGWLYLSSEEPLEPGCVTYLTIKYFAPNFSFITLDASLIMDDTTSTDEWLPLSVRGTVPSNATLVQGGAELLFDGACSGTAYWDDLTMRKVGPQ